MAEKKKLGPGRHLSAIKRHRQSIKRAERNKSALSAMRTSIKKLGEALEAKDGTVAENLFRTSQTQIAKAMKRGLIHAKAGQRKIGRLHRRLQALSS